MGTQLSILDALEQGHAAAEACAQKAGASWVMRAVEALTTRISIMSGADTFTVEELREQLNVGAPHDLRAWGHVTRECVKRGLIKRVPNCYRRTRSSHGSPKPVYMRGPSF